MVCVSLSDALDFDTSARSPRVNASLALNAPAWAAVTSMRLSADTSTVVVEVAVLPQSSVAVQVMVVTLPAAKLERPEPLLRE